MTVHVRISLIALLFMVGCASAEERRAARSGPIQVEVTNNNVLDVTVFAVAGSQTIRLGTVTTNSTRTFELPAALPPTGDLRFLIDPIGSRDGYLSDEVIANPGDIVGLVVQSRLSLSSTSVR